MQRHELLIQNRFFTGTPENLGVSRLIYKNGYLVNMEGERDKIVTSDNVRAFLGDKTKNQDIITDFFNYIENYRVNSSNIPLAEAKIRSLYYNNEKLSNVFNEYYNTSVISGNTTLYSFIDQEFYSDSDTNSYYTTVVSQDNYYNYQDFMPRNQNYNGNTPWKIPTSLVELNSGINIIPGFAMSSGVNVPNATTEPIDFSENGPTTNADMGTVIGITNPNLSQQVFYSGESYFIDVYLERTSNNTKRLTFEPCKNNQAKESLLTSGYYSDYYNNYGGSPSIAFTAGTITINPNSYSQYGNLIESQVILSNKPLTYSAYAIIAANLIKEGFIITGSLALSKFGKVYRDDIPHDIDVYGTTIDHSINEELIYTDINLTGSFEYNYNLALGQNIPLVPAGVNKILDLYPAINTILKVTESKNQYTYTYLLRGGPVSIDFIAFKPAYINMYNVPSINGLATWEHVLESKRAIGRPKDLMDIDNFTLFGEIKSIYVNTFQKTLTQCFVDLAYDSKEDGFWK